MAHTTTLSVRFYELDPYDHLNHSVYIQYFETARIELLREAGCDLQRLRDEGYLLVVSEIHTRFLSSAGMGDELEIETEVRDVRRVTTTWVQRMLRGGELIASQELTAAMITVDGKPTRFPEWLVESLRPYFAADGGER